MENKVPGALPEINSYDIQISKYDELLNSLEIRLLKYEELECNLTEIAKEIGLNNMPGIVK